MDEGSTMIIRDGVPIPLPTPEEAPLFEAWLKTNGDKDPYHPAQHYDLLGAFRAGYTRTDKKGNPSPKGHLPDIFKLPGHPTFSIESRYYKPGMPAGRWEGNKYIPIKNGEF